MDGGGRRRREQAVEEARSRPEQAAEVVERRLEQAAEDARSRPTRLYRPHPFRRGRARCGANPPCFKISDLRHCQVIRFRGGASLCGKESLI